MHPGGLARWHACDSQHAQLLAAARAPNLCADRAVLCACVLRFVTLGKVVTAQSCIATCLPA